MNPSNYIKWVENVHNGLVVKKDFNEISYQILFKPYDYLIAKELNNGTITKNEIPQKIKDLGDMQYATLRIESKNNNELLRLGTNNENEYFQRLEYLMSEVQNDIYLIEDKDTIPCVLSHFERTYGLAPFHNIVLGFGKTLHKESDKTFVYDDKLFGTGKIMLKINSEDLKQIPHLELN